MANNNNKIIIFYCYLPTGSIWKTPFASRIIFSFAIFRSIGIGPGEVILFGGRSSFKRNDILSKYTYNKNYKI